MKGDAMDNKEEMPLGFSFSLAMDEKAMDRFAAMSEAEKNRVIGQAKMCIRDRDKLVADNMGLIWSIVRRFAGRGHEMEDLFQIGSIGLLKAIDKFDLSYDVKFSTYAVPMITGEIKRFLRDDGMIKVSRSLKEDVYKRQVPMTKAFLTVP